jgi:hypothetical protein
MSRISPSRLAAVAAILSIGGIGQIVGTERAGAVAATRAELKSGQLRVEGRGAPGARVITTSTTSAASARADQSGLFKIQATGFTAPDCLITVDDGRTPTATVSLAGCTPSITPVPPVPEEPTGSCVITPEPLVTLPRATPAAVFFETTGCNTTLNSGATPTPVQWRVVAGSIPTGMTGPNSQGTTAGAIIGTPSIAGTYRFTLQVTDQAAATDQETLTVDVF